MKPSSPPRSRKQILLVDDDTETLRSLEEFLGGYGYASTLAANGVEAMALLRALAIDLVILDLMMPGGSGYEFLQARNGLDAAKRNVPVVVVSASPAALFMREVEAVFQKPVRVLDLLGAVDRCIGPGSMSVPSPD